ncbi:hypothetical protein [Microbacterium hominis]|uniref:hypothetical protein n=1 Tax=Microbacterium hominis TaxID=162426 RepID=UPI0012E05E0C|nr:hypothetical protein [Microbacterium hominis]
MKSPLLLPATAIAVLVLAGCAASPASTPSVTENDAGPTAEAGTPAAVGGGQLFGCTDAMISFMDANGYLNPTPADPTRFVFPEAGKPGASPACYVEDDYGGTKRKGAIFVGDAEAAIAQIGATLTSAGYQQSSGYGAYIWWLDGEDASSARYAVGAGPQQIDGQNVIWATWASD